MLTPEMETVIEASRADGWILEPDAKRLLADAGLDVARHAVADSRGDLLKRAETLGYPLVAKVVSPQIVHKSDCGGVVS